MDCVCCFFSGVQKWTSDSELYKADAESDDNWRTLQVHNRSLKSPTEAEESEEHPLRRSRAHIRLAEEATPTVLPTYSEHEMEDWILRSSSEELLHQLLMMDPLPVSASTAPEGDALPIIQESEDEVEEEEEEEEEDAFFARQFSSPECDIPDADAEAPEEEEGDGLPDTEFTRDFYRLVKFESNRSLANSEKYDHCPSAEESGLLPPDRQVKDPFIHNPPITMF